MIKRVNEMIKEEVKACPFCGEKNEIYLEEYEHEAGLRWRIVCANCMAGIDRGYVQQPYELVNAWNKRQ